MIPFNKSIVAGNELNYIKEAISSGKIASGGHFSNKCSHILEKRYHSKKVLLTKSCTAALEMCALLLDIHPGDEVIVPSFSYVSTANSFALRGASICFADIDPKTLNITPKELINLISPKTKALVVLHYAGISCEMDEIIDLCQKKGIVIIEDAALSIDAYYNHKALGTLGDLGCFSFHETKNISSGEGGALFINNLKYKERAEIILNKGTNRAAHLRGDIQKYEWQDLGSSYALPELNAAYLLGQLEKIDTIQKRRIELWHNYQFGLNELEMQGKINLPFVPESSTVNGSVFYFLCLNKETRDTLIDHLRNRNIYAVFHYIPLHTSPYIKKKQKTHYLPISESYSARIIRLPLYYKLTDEEQWVVIEEVISFFKQND